ncbi:glutathione peroxidase [Saccharobesus litoralis]|uniref:Glutathione peroxidase n=1 Tax=Saccharobesus litoralis TaxID=2172099 RepID=A0A2S0VVY4_9ALTE|nr:glutathione peroxidase [Saccharobesus litoralis]AWB68368.1 glutathione peroxidase [Saccharobesus litoralis]
MLTNKENQNVPSVNFPVRVNDDWQTWSSESLFAGKKVIVFALPGAFTPTCSSSHLPRYNELAPTFKANGIDDIICLSVNDTFVMNAWAADQNAEHIRFLPDGNGEFSEKIGMLVDKANLGFGKRSWRYSMLVNDGVIEKMFIEPEVEGDPFEVSDADTMLQYVAPEAVQSADVTIVTKPGCPYCAEAKTLLKDKGLAYQEIELASISIAGLRALSGRDTVPQVFIDGKHIGGSDDLEAHFS